MFHNELRVLARLAAVLLVASLVACEPEGGTLVKSAKARLSASSASEVQVAQLTRDNRAFALDLYGKLKDRPGNLFLSPHSVSIALGMTWAGAKGSTETQMGQALHFSRPQLETHAAFNALDLQLAERGATPKKVELRVVNALWGQEGKSFETPFLDTLAENYGTGIRTLDFAKQAEASRKEINDWVASNTNDKIRDLLAPGVVNPDTRLVLTNAIYFNAAWQTKFDEAKTRSEAFHLLDAAPVDVPLMRVESSVKVASGAGYQAVEISYEGEELALLVLLPDQGRFFEVESALTVGQLDAAVSSLHAQRVVLVLPRFKFDSKAQLKEPLSQLGMSDAFTDAADFSGIDTTERLKIQDVVHQAYVDVNERGTEAAAATAVVMTPTSLPPPPPPELRVDRPFLFVIRDVKTGAALFLGRVLDPR